MSGQVADERLVLINETLQGARSVKLCAWESRWSDSRQAKHGMASISKCLERIPSIEPAKRSKKIQKGQTMGADTKLIFHLSFNVSLWHESMALLQLQLMWYDNRGLQGVTHMVIAS